MLRLFSEADRRLQPNYDQVLSLPSGQAIEDLLTVESYLGAVNEHLAECGLIERITAADLRDGKTRGKAVRPTT